MNKDILNYKIKTLIPYEPLTDNFKIRLDANESYINLNSEIIDEIREYIGEVDFNRYPDPYAKELVKVYSELYNIKPENLVAGNGSDELISIIINSFAQKGDTVLALTPDFSMYSFYSFLAELKVIELEKDDALKISKEDIINTIKTEKPRIVIFSNPCNPTGQGLVKEDVIDIVKSTDALVVVDEAYMDFWNESILDRVNEFCNLIILKTCSKMIGLAAIRLGFAVSGKVVINALKAAKSPYNVNSVTQGIGCIVLKHSDFIKKCQNEIIENKNQLLREIKKFENDDLKVFETVTNFVIIKTKYVKEIFKRISEARIAVRLIKNDYLRITAGSPDENRMFLEIFKECLK